MPIRILARLSLILLALSLIPVPASAKGPSKKQVDEAVLRLGGADRGGVNAAEAALQAGEDALAEAQSELEHARADKKAADQWVAAGKQILSALDLDREAAEAWGRRDELPAISEQRVRSESSLRWREARRDAAKEQIEYRTHKVAWAKSDIVRLQDALWEAKLRAYKAAVEDTPDLDLQLGKATTALGKSGSAEEKARAKRDKAEEAWKQAAAVAAGLAPRE